MTSPEQPHIQILLQNKNLLVVNKPAGLSIHNNEGPSNLMGLLQQQLHLATLFPVHRLDKETSGVQIFALNNESAAQHANAFQDRSVIKIYLGAVRGQLRPTKGSWQIPLTDKAEGRKNPQGLPSHRQPCHTDYQVLQQNRYFSLCEFHLHTGRQHQIRKHAALHKHHLVGDPRYGEPQYNKKIADLYQIPRLFLHCLRIHLLGITFEAPMPAEFFKLMPQQNGTGRV